jgi:hypothetical protein
MSIEDLSSHITLETIVWTIQTGWIVPAGMVALYFYGRFKLKTPEYYLYLGIGSDSSAADHARLITPTPPILTTRRLVITATPIDI